MQTDGSGLPGFVVNEFRKFLRCGVLGHGFARVRCENCAFERLVPFSCKGHAVCPSCGGRRMAERAAHLVDHVLPADVPVRQWVLSVPHRLRYRLAYDHRLCRTVLHVFVRALRSAYRRQARRHGLAGGETGMVTSVQRFGGAVNVHVHFHTLVLDGVFVREPDGTLRFHPAAPPTDDDVRRVIARVRRRQKPGAAGWPPARYGRIAWPPSTCRDRRPRACSTGSCARTSPSSSPPSTRRRTAMVSPGSS